MDKIKKNFGFGCMRFPMIGEEVDEKQVCQMVDYFLEQGFNYFDTARGYISGKSELAIKNCLTSRHPRESYILTDKLTGNFFEKEEDIRPLFESQLKRCGVEYFDFYLMHAQNVEKFEKFKKCHAYETALKFKEEGKIRHLGISFHDCAEVLDQILTEYPQVEVVQLQFNYIDYDDPAVQSGKCYEVCRKHGKPVIVMEPDTGKILTMVSQPNFNANLVDERWAELISPDNTKAQLVNRATQGLYPPGSTFKMLTVLEYMKENPNTWQDYVYNCNGSYQNGDYTIKCYHGTAHGAQNLIQAFANSCNGAFAEIGMQINSEKFRALANQMLFNSELPYTLPYNQSTFSLDGSSDDWEKLQTAIGQGKTQITPLHNLMIVSAIANGGTLMKPYMIDHVENVGGQTVKKFLPSAYGTLMSANDAQFLTHLMSQVVEIGTGSAMRGASYTVAGKTGSAEFEAGKETHSWFVGFAPADKPKVAICVLAEESGSGGAVAAPIARQVLDRYFAKYGQ